MPSTYTNNLGIQKPGTGEQSGSWGDTVNTNSDILDVGINGVLSLSLSGTSSTLTTSDGVVSNGQYKALVLAGSPSGTHTITISPNDAQKIYFVYNTTAQTVIFTQGSGGNVTLLTGDSTIIYANGAGSTSAVVSIADHLAMSSARITGGSITGITDLAVADGGTGASDAATARTNLGLTIGTNVQAYDAGLQSISGLTTAADRMIYTTALDVYAVATLTSYARTLLDDVDAATARTTLGLGTLATQSGTFSGTSSGTNTGDQNIFQTIAVSGQTSVVADSTTDTLTLASGTGVTITTDAITDTITISATGGTVTSVAVSGGTTGLTTSGGPITGSGTITLAGTLAVANGGTGATTAAAARTALGVAIGTDVQAYDAGLQSISGLTTAADRTIYTTASDTYAVTTLTTFGRSLIDDADAATARTTLGLGTMATQAASAVAITGGTASNTQIQGGSLTLGTEVATTSGTSVDFTGIPSWVKRITVTFNGVSTNSTSPVQIQLGDSGGIETSGYSSSAFSYNSGTSATSTSGLLVDEGYIGAAQLRYGSYVLTALNGTTWTGMGVLVALAVTPSAGAKALSATLDRIRITTLSGTGTFDAGAVNIMYEG